MDDDAGQPITRMLPMSKTWTHVITLVGSQNKLTGPGSSLALNLDYFNVRIPYFICFLRTAAEARTLLSDPRASLTQSSQSILQTQYCVAMLLSIRVADLVLRDSRRLRFDSAELYAGLCNDQAIQCSKTSRAHMRLFPCID